MRVAPRVGLSLVLSSVLAVVALSGLGFPNAMVWGAASLALLPLLFGALAWIYPARRRRDFPTLLRQRNALLACLALLLSAPLTRWPLQLSFQLAKPTLVPEVRLGHDGTTASRMCCSSLRRALE